MTRWILLALLIVALSAIGTVAVGVLPGGADSDVQGPIADSKPKGPGPFGKAVVDGDLTYNFGTMSQMNEGTHTWTLTNKGQGNLTLTKGSASCTCTIANLAQGEKAVVKPNESTKIALTWETRMKNGHFETSATIYVENDLDNTQLEFHIEGTVRPAILTVPQEPIIDYGSVSNDQPHMGHVAMWSPDRPDLKIESFQVSNPDRLEVTQKPLGEKERKELKQAGIDAGPGYQVDIKLKPGTSLGPFREEVRIKTDHPRQQELVLSVSGRMMGPVSVTPEQIRAFRISSHDGGEVSATIWVRNRDSVTTFSVAKAPEGLKVEVTPVDVNLVDNIKARQYRMTVKVAPGTPIGEMRGTIELKTDDPRAELVKVPVDIRVDR
jgi:hypothetical protein